MKRFLRVLLAPSLLCLSLTACQVNWFDKRYDVPWWFIAVPVTILTVVIFWLAGRHIANKQYPCPSCGQSFHPTWRQAILSLHVNDERLFKCPHCGKRSFCHLSYKPNDD